MNSIESYSPPKFASLGEEGDATLTGIAADPAALEALRAMIGAPVTTPAPGFGVQIVSNEKESDAADPLGRLMAAIDSFLSGEDVPADLAAMLASLQGSVGSGGAAASSPETLEQMRALLAAITGESPSGANGGAATPSQGPGSGGAAQAELLRQALQDAFVASFGAPSVANAASSYPVAMPRVESQVADVPLSLEQPMPPDVATLGHAILQSLDHQSAAAAATNGLDTVPTVERVEQVSQLMTELADRVLVTDPLHGQTQEVRIRLAENVMPGTEVRMWRAEGGELRVEFETTSGYWARVLNDASVQLSQRLNERLDLREGAQVTVQQHSGQPEDGRSRNRHMPWEFAQASEEQSA